MEGRSLMVVESAVAELAVAELVEASKLPSNESEIRSRGKPKSAAKSAGRFQLQFVERAYRIIYAD